MNIQTDPSLLKGVIEPLPASADQPIRSTFFHEANMRKFGEELAQSTPAVPGLTTLNFQRRIRENGKKILEVYRATNDAQAKGEVITPAAQWLLDNHYLIDETVFQVKRDLPRRFYKELPAASYGGASPLPRSLAIAWAYVAHSDSSVSVPMFEAIVEGYQSVEPLKIGELGRCLSLLRLRADREPAQAGSASTAPGATSPTGSPTICRRGRRRKPPRPSCALPEHARDTPSPRSCCTGCATARAMQGARWSGSRPNSNATAPTPRR